MTEELPGGGVFGFADDTNLVGTNSDCVRAFVKFEEMVSELALSVNRNKCIALVTNEGDGDKWTGIVDRVVVRSLSTGVKVLGAPIGL